MNNIQIGELLTMIHEAKQDYIQGNDVYDYLDKIDVFVSNMAIDSGMLGKMSKSEGDTDEQ